MDERVAAVKKAGLESAGSLKHAAAAPDRQRRPSTLSAQDFGSDGLKSVPEAESGER